VNKLVEFLARGVVAHPDAVKVESTEGEASVELRLSVDPQDLGALNGPDGVTMTAIRTVLASSSGRRKAILELADPATDAS
jgi:predicted RNA-binding protein YlqC (UPF0109 family)